MSLTRPYFEWPVCDDWCHIEWWSCGARLQIKILNGTQSEYNNVLMIINICVDGRSSRIVNSICFFFFCFFFQILYWMPFFLFSIQLHWNWSLEMWFSWSKHTHSVSHTNHRSSWLDFIVLNIAADCIKCVPWTWQSVATYLRASEREQNEFWFLDFGIVKFLSFIFAIT